VVVRAFGRAMAALRAALTLMGLLVAVAAIVVVRTLAAPAAIGAPASPDALRDAAASSLEAALAPGGSGISFEVVQTSTLHAKPDGPRIELRDPADPQKVTGIVDEYQVGTLLSRGGATADAFWMDLSIDRDNEADFETAELFARVLARDGKLWRDDGIGWYLTDASPGVGMDPVSTRALAGALRSLANVKAVEPAIFDGRSLAGLTGTSTPDAYPGVIAADGAAFTEKTFPLDCRFDDQGRLVRLEASARSLNEDTYDLVTTTVVTISYGSPGDPPAPNPTMAPEVLPTSAPGEVAE
jgi:hypothetical protein